MTEEYIGAELHGPFVSGEYFKLSYEGKIIPHLKAQWITESTGIRDLWVILDDRLMFGTFTEDELIKIMPLLANAMAFSAGHPCHGTDLKINQHNVGISGIRIPTRLTPIDGGKK